MFGRPQWFSMVSGRRDLRPRKWQGWLYMVAWLGVLVVPFVMLVTRHLAPEGAIWVTAALAVLIWDLRRIRMEATEPLDVREILVIDDGGSRMERRAV